MLNKYFAGYDSEEDENYEPTEKENRLYDLEHQKKARGKRGATATSHELYLQMKQEYLQAEKDK